ncbi:hypothetical protein [Marinobacter subterrani]|uniref:hypothetical protein n=1 Tax=Marinobacter subterrani TaxID=1658765 RepID=UPI0023564426|nr:hypothetical protein [Marinobacter subterrani]
METQLNNYSKSRVGMRVTQVYFAIFGSLMLPSLANAAISDWATNIGDEFAVIVPIIVTILGAVGVLMAGFGIISAVMAKKNRQPMEYQHWLIIGGVLCVLLIPFVIGMGESISGQDSTSTVNGFMEQ